LAVLVGAAVIKPGAARTAFERLTSVAGLATENSYSYRVFESHTVVEAIAARPVTGSGFGATITWGVEKLFGTITTPFVHNGYLWLAWKIGIPAAAFVVLVLVRAVLRRCPSEDTAEWRILRKGSQASVLAILLTSLTFPPFNSLDITAAIGLLVAICYSRTSPAAASSWVVWGQSEFVPSPRGRPR
jgi:O-antigen ligase